MLIEIYPVGLKAYRGLSIDRGPTHIESMISDRPDRELLV